MAKMRKTAAQEVTEFIAEEDTNLDIEDEETPSSTDNAHKIPLFANADRRGIRTIAYLKLYKMEDKGWGYKGQLPLNSTLETIGQMYGDGLYTIEACNNKHKVLDTMEAVRISLGNRAVSSAAAPLPSGFGSMDADRIERLATRAADDARELNANYTKMIVSQAEQERERERERSAMIQKNMADYMSMTMAQAQQGFQQMMTLMQTSHTQTMQQMMAMNKAKDDAQPNQMQMVELLLKGIMLGRDIAGDEQDESDKPIWEQIMGGGFSLLKAVADSKASAQPTALASSNENPRKPKLSKQGQQMLAEALTLHKAIRSSGLTVEEVMQRLQVSPPASTSAQDEEDEADEDEDLDSESDDDSDDDESSEFTPVSGTN